MAPMLPPCPRFLPSLVAALTVGPAFLSAQTVVSSDALSDGLTPTARAQIQALLDEKAARSPAQQKLDSRLIYALKAQRGQPAARGVGELQIALTREEAAPERDDVAGPRNPVVSQRRVLMDIEGSIDHALLKAVGQAGGTVVSSTPQLGGMRAWLPLAAAEKIAMLKQVRWICPAREARTTGQAERARAGDSTTLAPLRTALESARAQVAARRAARSVPGAQPEAGSVVSEAVKVHRADSPAVAALAFGGLKIGVLSDSIDNGSGAYDSSRMSGNVSRVTVLPGQAGTGAGEGLAMCEVIYDMVPGAQLYFASAFNGPQQFAQNILDLRAAGCQVIVDDVSYFYESPFYSDVIERAVDQVVADGAIYFSSAGNQGNRRFNSATVWEGDFVDGGPVSAPLTGTGRVNQFPAQPDAGIATPQNYAQFPLVAPTANGDRNGQLSWSDPGQGSTNDYDLFYLNETGTTVLAASTNVQNGTQDPYESTGTLTPAPYVGKRFVIVKSASAQARFLHLNLLDGFIRPFTGGRVRGHNSPGTGFSVAAAAAAGAFTTTYGNPPAPVFGGPFPNPYSSTDRVEPFTTEGPRRVFYNNTGTVGAPVFVPITPGNFLSTGGTVRQKPDFTAADGTETSVPGFQPFYGTSCAAPNAAAIGAMVLARNPVLTPAQVATALNGSAIDVEVAGTDPVAGRGIIMADTALVNVSAAAGVAYKGLRIVSPDGNGKIDRNEVNQVFVALQNPSGSTDATGVTATLSTATAGVTVTSGTATFPALPRGGAAAEAAQPFLVQTAPDFVCGTPVTFTVTANAGSSASFTRQVTLPTNYAVDANVQRFDTAFPAGTSIPDNNAAGISVPFTVSGFTGRVGKVKVSVYCNNSTYIGDLVLDLIAPNGTTVRLSANVGSTTASLGSGTSDAQRCTFDDDAAVLISDAAPPFAGSFRPSEPLTRFVNLDSSVANGVWTLRIADVGPADVSQFQVASIFLQAIACP